MDEVDRIADIWGPLTPHARGTVWPARVDTALRDGTREEDVERWVRSSCTLCSNGCACDLAVAGGRLVGIRGRATDVVNHGRLGPKGLFGHWTWQDDPARLRRPLVRDGGRLVETDWDTAMGRVVAESSRLLRERGPLSHGFYTSGQLTLEEYYTLGVIGKAGIGTPHMDGNTRLCTATSGAAFKESFGCDGQPGSYTDIEFADAIFLFGHNMPETQTVLWMRVLDRTRGEDSPAIVCVDPRRTPVADEAERTGGVHLAVRPGTNQAILNGLTRELFANGWVDEEWVAEHTIGRDELQSAVEPWTPERTGEVCGVDPDDVRRAARVFGTSQRVLSTVLQGFYQSHQATSASCGVHNLHLLRGLIGKVGSGVLQMNGQPTAQNTRETGADGDLPGFRNWANPDHIEQLARLWDVDADTIPHWSPPTHAMQIMRYVEEGSIGWLWVQASNPAVSMPDSARIRRTLSAESCFLVVSDLYLTETAQLADVVLPAAGWAEKTGCSTNVNRTVHLAEKAVEPPGEARSDFDSFLDYARRMDFRDKSGRPLPRWDTSEGAFDAWCEATRGRPVDYTGLSYAKLRASDSGIPWPCNDEAPEGTDRLYTTGVFPTHSDYCETYGHDALTGASRSPQAHRALRPDGRAFLIAAPYVPLHDPPDAEYPLLASTGRTVYQFHTRTKTGRSRQLRDAAPEPWVELSVPDAEHLGIAEGDLVRVVSRRGQIDVRARIGDVREGTVFAPFHYGYWDLDADQPGPGVPPRAANELTTVLWDVISKQPLLKTAPVRVEKLQDGGGRPSAAPTTAASHPARSGHRGPAVPPTRGGPAATTRSEVLVETPHYRLDPAQGAQPVDVTPTLAGPAAEDRP